jgi:hypothetical protein
MPDLRAIVIAFGVGFGVGGYFTLWWHWPLAIGGGLGLVLGGLALVGTMSVAKDPTIADDAWKAAAPEFVDPPAEPGSEGPSAAASSRSRDLPSGD